MKIEKQVKRYWPGKAPEWADDDDEGDIHMAGDVVEHRGLVEVSRQGDQINFSVELYRQDLSPFVSDAPHLPTLPLRITLEVEERRRKRTTVYCSMRVYASISRQYGLNVTLADIKQ